MVKRLLALVLVYAFASEAHAADRPGKENTGKPNVVTVSKLLKQIASSPLGPNEARLLRAMAELVEKELVTAADRNVTASADSNADYLPRPLAQPALPPLPASQLAQPENRTRLAIRLMNASVNDVAKALENDLVSQQPAATADASPFGSCRPILVPERVTNTLLISAIPKMAVSLKEQVAKLDARPDMVAVQVCIANFVMNGTEGRVRDGPGNNSPEKAPSMDGEGAAWLEWATKHGRLEVLSRPQVMTLDNRPAMVQVGSIVRRSRPKPGLKGSTEPSIPGEGRTDPSDPARIGVTMGVTPRISPEGLIVMELDVEHASIVSRDGAGNPIIGKVTAQTTISAKDGQTVVIGGLIREEGRRQLIVAVTPRVHRANAEVE